MIRRLAILAAAAVLLAGCGQGSGPGHGWTEDLAPVPIELPDGRTVTCVVFDGNGEAALSCDWQAAK